MQQPQYLLVVSELRGRLARLVDDVQGDPDVRQEDPHTVHVASLAGTHQTAGQAGLVPVDAGDLHQPGDDGGHVVAGRPHQAHADLLGGQL